MSARPGASFSIPVRIYYEDTDAAGVVYYAGYLRFMERARTEWLRSLGYELDELTRREGIVFAVRSVKVDYVSPARLNDRIDVSVELKRARGASFLIAQRLTRADTVLCEGDVLVACLDARDFVPRRLPQAMQSKLNAWKTP